MIDVISFLFTSFSCGSELDFYDIIPIIKSHLHDGNTRCNKKKQNKIFDFKGIDCKAVNRL